MSAPRIVSLLPAATEIVAALGHRDGLVGRSHECDYPPGVESLPPCTAPRLDASRDSRRIDDDVRALLRDALSIYELHVERLAALEPDVVVTQTQCEVCAVPLSQVEQAARSCLAPDARIVSLAAADLDAVWDDVRRVAAVLDVPERAEALLGRLGARIDAIAARAAARHERPRVVTLEWIDPLLAGGHWMPALVRLAGGREALPARAGPPLVEWDELRKADPDVVVVLPCGFDLARTRAEARALTERPGWRELRAVRDGRVYVTDGNRFFNRPGPRLVESLEVLAELVHPDAFDFGHEGTGWARMAIDG